MCALCTSAAATAVAAAESSLAGVLSFALHPASEEAGCPPRISSVSWTRLLSGLSFFLGEEGLVMVSTLQD